MKYCANTDGVNHINIYSKGRTELGQFLSNFAYSPIEIDGLSFASLEGYWFWLRTHDERLRSLFGFEAKDLGGNLKVTVLISTDEFKKKFRRAMNLKIQDDRYYKFQKTFIESTLPFAHYYVYNGKIKKPGHQWVIEHWTLIRSILKEEIKDYENVYNM
jgi:hypothetical protein